MLRLRLILLALCVSFASLLPANEATAVELLADGGFESGSLPDASPCGNPKPYSYAHWTARCQSSTGIVELVPSPVHDGNWSLHVDTRTSTVGRFVWQDLYTSETCYQWSFWMRPGVGHNEASLYYDWDRVSSAHRVSTLGIVYQGEDSYRLHFGGWDTMAPSVAAGMTTGTWQKIDVLADATRTIQGLFVNGEEKRRVIPTTTFPPETLIVGDLAGDAWQGEYYFDSFSLDASGCPRDSDRDGLFDGDEMLDHGTNPLNPDTDGDGCADGEEVPGPAAPAPKPGSTGAFDPLAWYDFYDVPVPAYADMMPNGPRDQGVGMGDVLAVLFYVFASDEGPPNANGVDYDSTKGSCDWNGDTTPDEEGLCYDRSAGAEPNPPWDAGPPNGVVNMADVLAALAQFGLSCSGPP
jgi:hypothetical protein